VTEREWDEFTVELEATFRGGLAEDRERALRKHFGEVPLADAQATIVRLVSFGQVWMPTPGEIVAAFRRNVGDNWRAECMLAGQTTEERRVWLRERLKSPAALPSGE